VNCPEEGTDISPETLVSCQRMTRGNNPEPFIQDNNQGDILQSHKKSTSVHVTSDIVLKSMKYTSGTSCTKMCCLVGLEVEENGM
jgi:hypothetical protein